MMLHFRVLFLLLVGFVAIAAAAPITTPPSPPQMQFFLPLNLHQLLIAATLLATIVALGYQTRKQLAKEWPEDPDATTEDRFAGFLNVPVSEPVEDEKLLAD
ncbi:hypothetical protein EX30DRAFT_346494 [Ascodesmis nigricans]|uniref:Uncharacterized protein n=1 Tax=Ascodesmis nigricans TaxID=341454 RepID=A0A4S2N3W1_9PEZI|nr:hypothetical protein EX30DRAFT_346494 [Ascodesmis nigricans]